MASDPKGRAVMIGAAEKQKLVYILNRDSNSKLTISSPLSAHKNSTVCFDICGVDAGFENPLFAVLEVDYDEVKWQEGSNAPQFEKVKREFSFKILLEIIIRREKKPKKELSFYELDLGLNHVVRKLSQTVDSSAHRLLSVPGDVDGPGGVLVCSENKISWYNLSVKKKYEPVSVVLPRREGLSSERSTLIVSHSLLVKSSKSKSLFFFILQTEYGDLFKLSLKYTQDVVESMELIYFDTVPVSTSISILKNGFLFVASEHGDHHLYRFQTTGDARDSLTSATEELSFAPRSSLKNLKVTEKVSNAAPVVQSKLIDLFGEDCPQVYSLCGKSANSTLRVLRHGLAVTEIATSDLPASARRVWCLKKRAQDLWDSFIVISFLNATLILAVEGTNVAESADSGLAADVQTIHADLLRGDSFLQVHPYGWRQVRADKRVVEWKCPGKKTVSHAASNAGQLLVALGGGELHYFELDESGALSESERTDYGSEVACLAIAPLPEGLRSAKFAAVGEVGNTVRVVSLEGGEVFERKSLLTVDSTPTSACIAVLREGDSTESFLFVGLENGVLQRISLDAQGELSDTRRRVVGKDPVKLAVVTLGDAETHSSGVVALSSRTWLTMSEAGKIRSAPFSYVPLDWLHSFSSSTGEQGYVAISKNSLRVISTDSVHQVFNQTVHPLRYTPRKMTVHPPTRNLVLVESEMGVTSVSEDQLKARLTGGSDSVESVESARRSAGPARVAGAKWASALRMYDPRQNKTVALLELGNNEALFSLTTCHFALKKSEGHFVIVGGARGLSYAPKQLDTGFLDLYKVDSNGFTHVHRTEVEDVPLALSPFHGRLLVAVGKMLRIYDIGKKKLLKKCENKMFPRNIVSLNVQGHRIMVGDITESFLVAHYDALDNKIDIVADDTFPRWLTAAEQLDYDTMAGADKFGNFFVARLPDKVSRELKEETGDKLRFALDINNGARYKFDEICQFHVGELITSLNRGSLIPGGMDSIIYTSIYATIGAFLPFVSREDIDFFSQLEMHMRQARPPLCGRDHLAFRSFYFPVRCVIDGDLCEQYSLLEPTKQREIAEEIGDRTPSQILKKLEDIRQILF